MGFLHLAATLFLFGVPLGAPLFYLGGGGRRESGELGASEASVGIGLETSGASQGIGLLLRAVIGSVIRYCIVIHGLH